MAHQLTIRGSGLAEMAYTGEVPWHGLGQSVPPGADIEQWRIAAGLDWEVERSTVQFQNGQMRSFLGKQVLHRSDNHAPLSVVSDGYRVVQPGQVLEFFQRLQAESGFQIETAGSLNGGRRIWALARTGFDAEVVRSDMVRMYLLLVTSYDRGMATSCYYTSVRVVCNNTLQLSAVRGNQGKVVKIRHNREFCPEALLTELGLNTKATFDSFMNRMQHFADIAISQTQAENLVEEIFASVSTSGKVREGAGFKTVMNLFNGAGKGARLDGVANTGWGLLNAFTEYTDFHKRAQSQDSRLTSAWMGKGADLKDKVVAMIDNF